MELHKSARKDLKPMCCILVSRPSMRKDFELLFKYKSYVQVDFLDFISLTGIWPHTPMCCFNARVCVRT